MLIYFPINSLFRSLLPCLTCARNILEMGFGYLIRSGPLYFLGRQGIPSSGVGRDDWLSGPTSLNFAILKTLGFPERYRSGHNGQIFAPAKSAFPPSMAVRALDKIAGSDFEPRRISARTRRAEYRTYGVNAMGANRPT
jgi:hypothetical protein